MFMKLKIRGQGPRACRVSEKKITKLLIQRTKEVVHTILLGMNVYNLSQYKIPLVHELTTSNSMK
jgi:hypothetical protein